MTDAIAAHSPLAPPGRLAGAGLIACAVVSVILLLNHPGGEPKGFADVLRLEAANQGADAAVHGGFIAVLAIQFALLATLGARLGLTRRAVIAALVFTAAGSVAMAGSMLVDGLVVPAIAAKYLAATPDKLEYARALFVLCGILIRFLMPIGLAFLAAGMVGWSLPLAARAGLARIVGFAGLVIGAALLVALGATVSDLNPFVVMGGLAAQALWIAAVGALMAAGRA